MTAADENDGTGYMPRILLVEEKPEIRKVLHDIFDREHFDVREAGECVHPEIESECRLQCRDDAGVPDVLLVAVIGKRYCSGVELALKALEEWPEVKVLLTSTCPAELWTASAKALFNSIPTGSYAFLPKPFTAPQVVAAARGLLA